MGTVHAKGASPPETSKSKITSQPQLCNPNDEAKTVDFAGIETRVDKIHVEGLTRTKDDIIIESVQDLFLATDFEELMALIHTVRERLGNLGCFRNIGAQIDTSSGAESTANGVEVTFYVKELKRLVGGVSTLIGSNEGSLVVSVRAPNIFGRGERLQAEYSHGSESTSNLSFSYIKPLRTRYDAMFSSSIFKHSSDCSWSGYRCVERGLLFDLAFYTSCMVKHNIQYEGAWRELSAMSKTSSMSVREESGHTLKSAVRHILTVDKRDALIFPTKGNLFRFTTELAGLGGDVSFLKNDFYWQYNIPLYEDIVVQTTLQAGVLTAPFSETMTGGLPDRLYNGGPLSVRGFNTRGIGPRDAENAVGANFMWGTGLHLFTPLPFRPGRGGFGDLLRIHFFTNMGQCKQINWSHELSQKVRTAMDNIRMSCGAGLALRLGQMAQVELNYAVPLWYDANDAIYPGLQFGVGLQFL